MPAVFNQILEQNIAFGERAFIGGTAFADFDGDGRIEIVGGPFTLPLGPFHDINILERQDDGTFENIVLEIFDGRAPLVRDATNIVVADLNGDGFDDLIVANNADGSNDFDAVGLSNGRGQLVDATFEFEQLDGPTNDIAVGDFDGDGRQDIFFAKLGSGSSHFVSVDSQGNFESNSIAIPDGVNELGAVTAADIDGDGRDEVIAGVNQGVDPEGRNAIGQVVNGAITGVDLPVWQSLTGRTDTGDGVAVLDVEVFDANNDGRLDILFVGASAQTIQGFDFQLLTQRSNGTFKDSTADFFTASDFNAAVPSTEFAPGVEIADLDADGDLDLYLLVDFPFGDRIFFREGNQFVLDDREFDVEGVGAAVGDVDGDFSPEIFTFSQFNIRGFDNGLQGLPVTEDGVFVDGELIDGDSGANAITGTNRVDVISGGGGADSLNGGGGNDVLSGGGGKDLLIGGGGKDTLKGGGGKDELNGGGGKDLLEGGGGKDALNGGGGKDVLDGGGGKDILNGGGGRDDIDGGRGRDFLSGGGGRDTFHFERGSGKDVIEDWRDGQDKIAIDGASFDALTILQRGDDVLIRFSNFQVEVENANANQFTAADFIF